MGHLVRVSKKKRSKRNERAESKVMVRLVGLENTVERSTQLDTDGTLTEGSKIHTIA